MSAATRSLSIGLLTSIALVSLVSVSARLYKESNDALVVTAQELQVSQVACR
ncbi:hypothetical protein HZA45_02820 [Candidatus Peregrinibacteria bacterium]|nr:hypothetical protein [Candidatus Peregrinibacteria bacterium]